MQNCPLHTNYKDRFHEEIQICTERQLGCVNSSLPAARGGITQPGNDLFYMRPRSQGGGRGVNGAAAESTVVADSTAAGSKNEEQ